MSHAVVQVISLPVLHYRSTDSTAIPYTTLLNNISAPLSYLNSLFDYKIGSKGNSDYAVAVQVVKDHLRELKSFVSEHNGRVLWSMMY
jgi:hypothetical protein